MTAPAVADPLAAIHDQLVGAAARRIARRRRRRRAAVVGVLLLLLVAAGAAAGGLTGSSTGVPVIDKLLDVESGDHGGGPDWRPGPGGASQPLPAPGLAGPKGVALAYLSRDGRICSAAAEDIGARGVRGSFGRCYEPADLARRLSRRGVVCCAFAMGPDRREYSGYADGEVTAVHLLVRNGRVPARLTPAWTPKAPGAEPQRFFVAADERDFGVDDDGVQPEDMAGVPGLPELIEVRYADGRVERVKPGP